MRVRLDHSTVSVLRTPPSLESSAAALPALCDSLSARTLHIADELLQAGADHFDRHARGLVALDLLQLFLHRCCAGRETSAVQCTVAESGPYRGGYRGPRGLGHMLAWRVCKDPASIAAAFGEGVTGHVPVFDRNQSSKVSGTIWPPANGAYADQPRKAEVYA